MLPDAYGCVVANRFGDLLDDEADPFDLISKAERDNEKKKKKKDDEEKRGKQKKPGQKESQKDRRLPVSLDSQEQPPARKQQQVRPPPVTEKGDAREEAQRGMKRASAGQRREKQEVSQEFSVPKPSYNADSEFRGRGGIRSSRRGARSGGYTRSQDTFNQRGKREYDRHNGTGISPEEKRGGRGPWNWGCVEEVASELMEVTPDPPAKSEEPQMTVEEETRSRATDDEDGEMVVQVSMEMSLDEWKALQETNRSKPEFKIRKAEDKIPTKAKVIHQSKQLENVKVTIDNDGNFLRRSVNDITSLLDINFGSLGRPSRGGRGRGRGGPSGRPERAHPILEREDDLPPNPDDPEDFPALSVGR